MPAHTCHWPGCPKAVPPAMWGCKGHWFALPKSLRDRIWATYRRGQEITKDPSPEYLAAATDVQRWIRDWLAHGSKNRSPSSTKERSMEKKHPDIALNSCESSQIEAHGHDPATNTLALQFKNKNGVGATYHYANFTQADYDAFRNAESLGRHFGQHIKTQFDKHPHTRVAEPPESEAA